MMGRNFGVEFDEDELMGELADLDAEIMDEELSLPTYIPGNKAPANNVPSQPIASKDKLEENELNDMMKMWEF